MYTAPLKDMRFVLDEIAGMEEISALPGYEHASADVVEAVLAEAARLAGEVWAPTNKNGDLQMSKLAGETVKTPDGFKDAYTQFAQGGWTGVTCAPDHGGQALPHAIGMAVGEMRQAQPLHCRCARCCRRGRLKRSKSWARLPTKRSTCRK